MSSALGVTFRRGGGSPEKMARLRVRRNREVRDTERIERCFLRRARGSRHRRIAGLPWRRFPRDTVIGQTFNFGRFLLGRRHDVGPSFALRCGAQTSFRPFRTAPSRGYGVRARSTGARIPGFKRAPGSSIERQPRAILSGRSSNCSLRKLSIDRVDAA